jgi:hypothetical protein
MYPKLFSFLCVSRSKQQSTHQCYVLAVHDVTESVLVQGDCGSSARPHIKDRQSLKSLPLLSQWLKSLLRGRANIVRKNHRAWGVLELHGTHRVAQWAKLGFSEILKLVVRVVTTCLTKSVWGRCGWWQCIIMSRLLISNFRRVLNIVCCLYSFTVHVAIIHYVKPNSCTVFKNTLKHNHSSKTLECLCPLCYPTCFGQYPWPFSEVVPVAMLPSVLWSSSQLYLSMWLYFLFMLLSFVRPSCRFCTRTHDNNINRKYSLMPR